MIYLSFKVAMQSNGIRATIKECKGATTNQQAANSDDLGAMLMVANTPVVADISIPLHQDIKYGRRILCAEYGVLFLGSVVSAVL